MQSKGRSGVVIKPQDFVNCHYGYLNQYPRFAVPGH